MNRLWSDRDPANGRGCGRGPARRRGGRRARARWLVALSVLAVAVCAGTDVAAQLTSVKVTLTTTHVIDNDIDPNNPEVQFRLRVTDSAGNNPYYVCTSKACEQPVCSHPFQGNAYVFRPLVLGYLCYPALAVLVIDDDGNQGSDVLTNYFSRIPDDPSTRLVNLQSGSHVFTVSCRIDKNVWKSGAWTPDCSATRTFADPLPGTSSATDVRLAVTLPAGLDRVQIVEEMGRGFQYQSSVYTAPPGATDSPSLDVVALAGADPGEEDLGTSLRWTWDSPTGGEHVFMYAVHTPATPAELHEPFGSETRLWDASRTPAALVFGNAFPAEQLVIGGAYPDCNGNGLGDDPEVIANPGLDCNGNGIPDTCDMADGTSGNCNGNAVPDECEIADGLVADDNLNGVPDSCEPSGVIGEPAPARNADLQVWPNPFNPGVEIAFVTARAGEVAVTIHDLGGRRLATVFHGSLAAGPQRLVWDGRDEQGRAVPGGVYLVRCRVGGLESTVKLTMLK